MRITIKLLIVLFIVFIMQVMIPGLTESYYFDPSLVMVKPYQFITSIFLHAGITHILFNAYALFLFGMILERRVAENIYLLIFLGAGIAGNIIYYIAVLLGIGPLVPSLGASGAIFGIMGAVGILFPDLTIFIMYFPMKMKNAIILWLVMEFIGSFNMTGVASAAHLGGLLFGILAGIMIKDGGIGTSSNGDAFRITYTHPHFRSDNVGIDRNYKLPWE